MKQEINCAAHFLVNLIQLNSRSPNRITPQCSNVQLELFKDRLIDVLRLRYHDHWFPEKPLKGSAYRCIRVNGSLDPVIAESAKASGLSLDVAHSLFPSELTLWIDPSDVSYRIGENGSVSSLLNVDFSGSSGSSMDCKSEYMMEDPESCDYHKRPSFVSS